MFPAKPRLSDLCAGVTILSRHHPADTSAASTFPSPLPRFMRPVTSYVNAYFVFPVWVKPGFRKSSPTRLPFTKASNTPSPETFHVALATSPLLAKERANQLVPSAARALSPTGPTYTGAPGTEIHCPPAPKEEIADAMHAAAAKNCI